jgi:hypothetical protein
VHKLTGRIAALTRFIVKLADKTLHFFSMLRGSTKVDWGSEQQQAFDYLKHHLEHLPTLLGLEQGQPLILYVSPRHSVVSGALVVEKEIKHKDKIAKKEFLLYFMSEVLMGSKKFYSEMVMICYTAIMSLQKLWHYFEAYTIIVLTNHPLNDIFGNRVSSRRISKWAMELSEYVIDFKKCNAKIHKF